MLVIDVANVQQAFAEGCREVSLHGVKTETRNGPAKVLPLPLTTLYRRPDQRVLIWEERDANPFFHLFESLWMLAGRRDVAWIQEYNSQIGQFSDDGRTFNGAYGYRWRTSFGTDQLQLIIENLQRNPNCRRQVLTMWSAYDLSHQGSKDLPCNTHAYFQVNTEGALDLMVCNRSNDLIWGAYGANAVHFSVLLEVVAAMSGLPMGRYFQTSMNTHVYERHWDLVDEMADHAPDPVSGPTFKDIDPYAHGVIAPLPLVEDRTQWFRDLDMFMRDRRAIYRNPFFSTVAQPLREAWRLFKAKDLTQAIGVAGTCAATDWKLAAVSWLQRRAAQ